MARRVKGKSLSEQLAEGQAAPSIHWEEVEDGWRPRVIVAGIVIVLEVRPLREFLKGERDAILVQMTLALCEPLFDTPKYLVHPETYAMAKNPDWGLLPYIEPSTEDSSVYVKVTPEPSAEQKRAGENLEVI